HLLRPMLSELSLLRSPAPPFVLPDLNDMRRTESVLIFCVNLRVSLNVAAKGSRFAGKKQRKGRKRELDLQRLTRLYFRHYGFANVYSRLDRQFQYDTGATGLKVFRMNFSAMLFHNAIADTQPQTGALAHRLGGVKRIKHAIHVKEARAVIV